MSTPLDGSERCSLYRRAQSRVSLNSNEIVLPREFQPTVIRLFTFFRITTVVAETWSSSSYPSLSKAPKSSIDSTAQGQSGLTLASHQFSSPKQYNHLAVWSTDVAVL